MKTLYLLRHAESSWDDRNLSDFERPLNERGRKDAPFMGEVIRKNNFQIDLILSSPAERAKQTARLVKEAGELKAEIRFDERIYEASPIRLLEIISELDKAAESAMLVGHNPGFEGLVRFLSGAVQAMPTAALAVIDLDVDDWREIKPECCNLHLLIRPKEEIKMHDAG